MKKLLLPLLIATSLAGITACGDCQTPTHTEGKSSCPLDKKHAEDNMHANKAGALAGMGALAMGSLDWDGMKASTADFTNGMDLSLPEGMQIKLPEGADAAQTVSKTWDTAKLNLFDGKQIVSENGKLDYLDIVMKKEGMAFDKAGFDSTVSDYMGKIGAIELFNDVIPANVSKQVNDLDGINIEGYMAGDFAERTVRQFAVNHADGKRIYQVMSDNNHGEIGILEVKNTSNTPTEAKEPTAEEMKAQLDNDQRLVLNINFDTAKSSIRPDSMDDVEKVFTMLSNDSDLKLIIEGHTDNTGNSQANKTLSQQRAETVMAQLVDKGIAADRLKAIGYGDAKPVVANDSAENRAKNRRVEVVPF